MIIIITEAQAKKLMKESIQMIAFDFEYGDEEFEEMGLDMYDVANDAHKLAKESNIGILSDKELRGVLIDDSNNEVAGAVWITNDSESFSFDVVVSPKYRRQGLSRQLIDFALEEHQNLEMMGRDIPIEVDVVNPMMAKILKGYGFEVETQLGADRVIMTKQ